MSEGIMEIQAEIYSDLSIELDENDWDWDDLIYPDHSLLMQSGVYYDFFHENALEAIQSLQTEMKETWNFKING